MACFNLPRDHKHWLYLWIPLFGSFIWASVLLAMLITWLASGRPKYVSQQGSIAYISDVGADILKPLFIVGCAITALSFFLAQCVETWLRYDGRLLPSCRRRSKWSRRAAILGAFIGGCGLILLSIFDTKRFTSLHRVFLLVFVIGVGMSAIFSIMEYYWLHNDWREDRKTKIAYLLKGVISSTLILLAIAFAVLLFTAYDPGAIVEWIIAFGFTFYILTYVYDLRMAKGIESGHFTGLQWKRPSKKHDAPDMRHV